MGCVDVLIIGGGPSGAAAAALLARAGRSVAILEKARFPRRKVCGELLSAQGLLALRRVSGNEDFEEAKGPAIRRVAAWTGESAIWAPLPAAARSVERERLDARLLTHAARQGAEVWQPAKALAIERECADRFVVRASFASATLELRARALVSAHGSWETGLLATQPARQAPRSADLFGFKARLEECALPPESIVLTFFPGGYGGLLPLPDGRVNFACCIRRGALRCLRTKTPGQHAGECVLRHALEHSAALRSALSRARRVEPWLAAGPLRPGARAAVKDGLFAIGNAACEVHPIVGAGIALALQSAVCLAEPLSAAFDAGFGADAQRQAARNYRAALRRAAWRRLYAGKLCASLAARAGMLGVLEDAGLRAGFLLRLAVAAGQ